MDVKKHECHKNNVKKGADKPHPSLSSTARAVEVLCNLALEGLTYSHQIR
jgi:hypothetical protein